MPLVDTTVGADEARRMIRVVGKCARARGAWIAIALAGLALGCRQVDNAAFCCTTADSCARFGVTAPDGCGDGLVCDDAAHTCLVPGTDHCSGPEDCSPALPFCVNEACAQCDGMMGCSATAPVCADLACGACIAETDCAGYATDGLPHCETTGAKAGQCVSCRSGADGAGDCADPNAPICDQNACRGCAVDDECASNVCDTSTGACVAENTVIYVAAGGTGTTCTQGMPCGSFALGLAQVTGLRKTIKVAPGSYSEAVAIAGKTVTIIGNGAELNRTTSGPIIDISGEPTAVTIIGMRLHDALGSSSGDGVKCAQTGGSAPSVTLQQMTLDTNNSKGVSATSCNLTVQRSTIKSNPGGGIAVTGGQFTIENNMLFLNGSTASTVGGVLVSQIGTTGTHVFRFNTLSLNAAGSGINSGVDCSSIGLPLTFSNSIVYGNAVVGGGKQVGGNNCAWTYSAISDSVNGMGNTTDDPGFADAGQHDYHLSASSLLKDRADPTATLMIDFDGDVRPQGTARDIGADEIKP